MWNEEDGFLYDEFADGTLSSTQGIYAYWVLHTDVLPKERLDKLVTHLADTSKFFRHHAPASLSAQHPKYKSNGRYWVGGVWPGATYMVISGLKEKGYDDLAWKIETNHYKNVFDVYKETGTFYEYYAPDSTEPGFMARKDFVGWTGLTPIAELIEYIFGIRSNVQDGKLTLDVNLLDAYGLDRYPFGRDGDVSIHVEKRSSQEEKPKVTIKSNVDFQLTLKWNGQEEISDIKANKK